jgi:hypothetical protein
MQQATKDKLTIIANIAPVLQELRGTYDLVHRCHKEGLDILPRKTGDDAETWLHSWRQGMKGLDKLDSRVHHLAGVVSDLTEDVLRETGYKEEYDDNSTNPDGIEV